MMQQGSYRASDAAAQSKSHFLEFPSEAIKAIGIEAWSSGVFDHNISSNFHCSVQFPKYASNDTPVPKELVPFHRRATVSPPTLPRDFVLNSESFLVAIFSAQSARAAITIHSFRAVSRCVVVKGIIINSNYRFIDYAADITFRVARCSAPLTSLILGLAFLFPLTPGKRGSKLQRA